MYGIHWQFNVGSSVTELWSNYDEYVLVVDDPVLSYITVPGVAEQALYLNNATSLMTISGENKFCLFNILNCTRGLTVSFWIHLAASSDTTIISNLYKSPSGHMYGYWIGVRDGQFITEVHVCDTQWTRVTSITVGMWDNIVMSWYKDNGIDLYINGLSTRNFSSSDILVSNGITCDNTDIHNTIILGGSIIEGNFTGGVYIDELRLTDNFLYNSDVITSVNDGK